MFAFGDFRGVGVFAVLRWPKVLRDVKGFLPESLGPSEEDLLGLTEEEAAELLAAKARQASCIRRFLGEEDADEPPPKTRKFRVATSRFLCGIDNALRVVTGHGLERFASAGTQIDMVSPEQRASLAS